MKQRSDCHSFFFFNIIDFFVDSTTSFVYIRVKYILDNTWMTLWLMTLVTLANHNVTVYKEIKKNYETERRKTLVTLWLTNVAMSSTTMSPKCYPYIFSPYISINVFKIPKIIRTIFQNHTKNVGTKNIFNPKIIGTH